MKTTKKDECSYSVSNAIRTLAMVRQLAIYSENSLHVLCDFLRDLQTIAQKAEQEEGKARRELQNIAAFEGFDQISEGALSAMRGLYDLVEAMEVIKDAAE